MPRSLCVSCESCAGYIVERIEKYQREELCIHTVLPACSPVEGVHGPSTIDRVEVINIRPAQRSAVQSKHAYLFTFQYHLTDACGRMQCMQADSIVHLRHACDMADGRLRIGAKAAVDGIQCCGPCTCTLALRLTVFSAICSPAGMFADPGMIMHFCKKRPIYPPPMCENRQKHACFCK